MQPTQDIKLYFDSLLSRTEEIYRATLESTTNAEALASSHLLYGELSHWHNLIEFAPESKLLKVACQELQLGLFSLSLGHYMHVYRALRLTLELGLQCVYLSSDRIALHEWSTGNADTAWSALIDNDSGVLSVRFGNAFFQDIEDELAHYRTIARKVYRELSQVIHGNFQVTTNAVLDLAFHQGQFDSLNKHLATIAHVLHFALFMRYSADLGLPKLAPMSAALLDRLGHIEPVRRFLGHRGGS